MNITHTLRVALKRMLCDEKGRGVKSKASDFDSFKKMYVIIVRWGFPNNNSNDYDATDTIILIHEYLSMDECKCACVTVAIKQQNAITSTTVQQQ